MTEDDIPRLKRGIQLKEKIEKIDDEIHILNLGVQIRVISTIRPDEWVAIPIHPQSEHEFADTAREFIHQYIKFLTQKKQSIQKQFDEL